MGGKSGLKRQNFKNVDKEQKFHKHQNHYPKEKEPYLLMDPETYKLKIHNCVIRPDKGLNSKARVKTAWTV